MKLKSCVGAFGFILTIVLIRADPVQIPTFASIIKSNGMAGISDGSSLFIFSTDGAFLQEPVGLSGRSVQGKWATDQQGARFTITGNWSWINGTSPPSDSRRMVIVIYPNDREPKFKTITYEGKSLKIYPVYFEIEELMEIPAGDGASPASH